MKRFHVHAHVTDPEATIASYSKMFSAAPTRVAGDYAKWMVEYPRIIFAIAPRGSKPGVDHSGIQADTEEERVELKRSAAAADMALLDVGETTCCHARDDKDGVTDPQGIAWKKFHTLGSIPLFNEAAPSGQVAASACCAGKTPPGKSLSAPMTGAPAASCC
jgi:hypothetical protein